MVRLNFYIPSLAALLLVPHLISCDNSGGLITPDCDATFDASKLTYKNYSDCEKTIAKSIENIDRCNEICAGSSAYDVDSMAGVGGFNKVLHCTYKVDGEENTSCKYDAISVDWNNLTFAEGKCVMDNMRADGSYRDSCTDEDSGNEFVTY